MATIESAYYGDEKARRNITAALNGKVVGTGIDVDVNEKLIPAFEVVDKTELSPEDVRKIKDQVTRACGNGVDQQCMTATEARLRQTALTEKETQGNSSANVIKGRRLIVNLRDADGKKRQVVVPDGQKFNMANISTNSLKGAALPSMSTLQTQLAIWVGVAVGAAIYVFSVAATYTIFFPILDYFSVPLIMIALFVPYSGFIMIFGYFMSISAMKSYLGK
jgi:hypothetical protein